ncbi:MAG: class I tRNA ligase family protein, partial [Planctomycetota bacterium]
QRGAVTSERFELGRNFCNKLWNASRFALTNLEGYRDAPATDVTGSLKIEDRWLLSRLATVTREVTDALQLYRYADAARALYDFAWNEFCSFYVEMTKSRFADEGPDKQVAQSVLAHGLDTLLRLLHPMTPFLTEEVWQLLGEVAPLRRLTSPARQTVSPARQTAAPSICIAPWPTVNEADSDPQIEAQFAVFQSVLGAVREVRQSQGIAWTETLEFVVRCDDQTAGLLQPMTPYFAQMAKASPAAMGPAATAPDIAASRSLAVAGSEAIEVHVDISGFIDVEAEKKRLGKERDQKAKFVKGLEGKLSNEKFVANAPAAVVEEQRAKLEEARQAIASIEASLAKLDS